MCVHSHVHFTINKTKRHHLFKRVELNFYQTQEIFSGHFRTPLYLIWWLQGGVFCRSWLGFLFSERQTGFPVHRPLHEGHIANVHFHPLLPLNYPCNPLHVWTGEKMQIYGNNTPVQYQLRLIENTRTQTRNRWKISNGVPLNTSLPIRPSSHDATWQWVGLS